VYKEEFSLSSRKIIENDREEEVLFSMKRRKENGPI